jgi:tetratricopeptide (TPR) repeat protein
MLAADGLLSPAGMFSGGQHRHDSLNPQDVGSARTDGMGWPAAAALDSARTQLDSPCRSRDSFAAAKTGSGANTSSGTSSPTAGSFTTAAAPAAAQGSAATESSSGTAEAAASSSKLAEQHHARGYAARKQGRFDIAIDEYSRALELEPRHFKALFNRGFSHDKVCVCMWGGCVACSTKLTLHNHYKF